MNKRIIDLKNNYYIIMVIINEASPTHTLNCFYQRHSNAFSQTIESLSSSFSFASLINYSHEHHQIKPQKPLKPSLLFAPLFIPFLLTGPLTPFIHKLSNSNEILHSPLSALPLSKCHQEFVNRNQHPRLTSLLTQTTHQI